jgi:hypothetical protein
MKNSSDKKEPVIQPKMQMTIDDHERIARITNQFLETMKSYRVAVDRLSKNEMRRVMIHVAEEPLECTVELTSEREKEAGHIGVTLKGMHTHLTLESLAQTPEEHKPEEIENE